MDSLQEWMKSIDLSEAELNEILSAVAAHAMETEHPGRLCPCHDCILMYPEL